MIVMPNLYGDILSDVAAQIAGSVGLAGSANIGKHGAMFEAIHGSAPRRAGQNLANPSGLLLAAVQMLVHIGEPKVAATVHNAWLKTLEDGIHTYDIFKPNTSKQKVGTREFAEAVVARLGQNPQTLKTVHYNTPKNLFKDSTHDPLSNAPNVKELMGVDVFVQSLDEIKKFHKKIESLENSDVKLTMIGNRGVRVWPGYMPETACGDTWRCRFMSTKKGKPVTPQQIIDLMQRFIDAGLDVSKTEHLCNFDGVPGYTLASDEQ